MLRKCICFELITTFTWHIHHLDVEWTLHPLSLVGLAVLLTLQNKGKLSWHRFFPFWQTRYMKFFFSQRCIQLIYLIDSLILYFIDAIWKFKLFNNTSQTEWVYDFVKMQWWKFKVTTNNVEIGTQTKKHKLSFIGSFHLFTTLFCGQVATNHLYVVSWTDLNCHENLDPPLIWVKKNVCYQMKIEKQWTKSNTNWSILI